MILLRFLASSLLVAAGALGWQATSTAEPAGTFALVSDIHFDPFDHPGLAKSLAAAEPGEWMARFAALPPGPASQYGSDTNHVLLSSALAAVAKAAADADFAIVGGDLLSHGFEDDTAKALANEQAKK